MRRFLTLVCLLGLALPAGISLSGCIRNPGGNTCNGLGYGLTDTQVASIIMQPQIAGISLAYGQTVQAQIPTAYTCHGETVDVGTRSYTYGTSNNQIVDISPTGAICAGTWNRNTGGGIPDYTYCNFPSPVPNTGGLPYQVAYITTSADSVTSNPVAVYIHAPVTSVSLVGPQACQSQSTVSQLDAEGCYASNGTQYELCAPASVSASGQYSCPGKLAPGVTSVPTCNASIGTMTFSVGTSSIASINATNNQITAELPGTTAITASIAGSGSSAGYFSTCPPASITTTLANGSTSGTVTQGVGQNLTTTVLDTNGHQITGLTLNYQSTNPIDISVAGGGTITTSFPGLASLTAICQPATCNQAPTNLIGFNGTGVPIASNPVNVTTPGSTSNYVWFAAPGKSQYFVPMQVLTGTLGSTVRLPYVPNSFAMDSSGISLYFGSARELMVYSPITNALGTESTSVPGVVLAVAPNNSLLLINDQARHLFYLYAPSGGAINSFPGMGNAAEWTPDSETLYITDNAELNTPASCPAKYITGHTDTLYVYNPNNGWNTYALPPSPLPASQIPSCTDQPNYADAVPEQTPAVMIPSVGAYLRGLPTVAHTWCPSGTVGDASTITYYPLGDTEPMQSDTLAATVEGHHILGAQWNAGGGGITLSDLAIAVPSTQPKGSSVASPNACPVTINPVTNAQTLQPLTITSSGIHQLPVPVNATAVNQIVTGETPVPVSATSGLSLAFITYDGSGANATLPYYLPASGGGVGTLGAVTLNGSSSITAPIAGIFSPDNTIFFVSTAGDNKIHFITIPNAVSTSNPPIDSNQVSPNLPACNPSTDAGCTYTGNGAVVPATVIVVKPRPIT